MDTIASVRGDRTLRTVMWLDAFLSTAAVLLALLAVPLLATVGLPAGLSGAVGLAAGVLAALLAACGAVTGVVLMLRMRRGHYLLPPRLWLPLPDPFRPACYRRTPAR